MWPELEAIEQDLPDNYNGCVFLTDDDDSPVVDTYFWWWNPRQVEEAYPKPKWLVEGVLIENEIIGLYGPSGHLKSFIARDLALSVALGEPWHGRQARRGTVFMVVAEGMSGMGVRLRTWRQRHKRSIHLPDNLRMIEHPIELLDPKNVTKFARDVGELAKLYGEREPVLIIIDTLGLCFGGDENSSRDMGTLVRHLDYLRRKCTATVLVLHHTDKTGKAERGSGSFRNRADMMIRVTASKSGRVTLKVDKSRDGKTGNEIHLEAQEEVLPDGESSLVFQSSRGTPLGDAPQPQEPKAIDASGSQQTNADIALQKLKPGMIYREWSLATGLKGGTFDRAKSV